MSRQRMRWELDDVDGPVVVIDVLRAFTTAAYAFEAGAEAIYLVSSVEEALAFKAAHAGSLAMGEDHGLRPTGFDFSNSPVAVSRADLSGRTMVQRTSAGTQGILAASRADRLWAASLVCASATASAITAAALGEPSYVITGCFADSPDVTGHDDRLTADLIERSRLGQRLNHGRCGQRGEIVEVTWGAAVEPGHEFHGREPARRRHPDGNGVGQIRVAELKSRVTKRILPTMVSRDRSCLGAVTYASPSARG